VTSLDPNFDAIYSGGLEASGDILAHHLLQESLSEYIAKISVIEVSLQAELPNYSIVRCFIFHHSALHQLLLLSLINKLQ